MAHKKGAGSSKNGRESHSKRLGVKIFGGQAITLMTLKSQSNALLGQLRAMKAGDIQEEPEQYEREQYTPPQPAPVYEQPKSQPVAQKENFDDLETEDDQQDIISILEKQDPLLIETEIQTKE